jgi:Tol biopolymer transport system component
MTMHDVKDELRRTARAFGSPAIDLSTTARLGNRRSVRLRLVAATTALAVVAVSGAFLVRAFDGAPGVAGPGLARVENDPISFSISQDPGVADPSRIGIVGADGPLVEVEGFASTNGWSPDGTHLAFSRSPDEDTDPSDRDIWVVDTDGENETQLTDGPAGDFAPQFSPDGQALMFQRTRDGESPALMVMTSGGSNLHRIAGADDEVIFESQWSPTGEQILTMGHPGEEGEDNWLAVMDAEGGNRRVIFSGPFNEPTWSPDGKQILISSQGQLLLVPVDGGEPTTAVEGVDPQGLTQVEWSPDGANILFTRPISPKEGEELWIVASTGGAPRLVADSLQWRSPDPAWSPNGSEIAFVRRGDIWTVDLASLDETQVTDTPEYESLPSWATSSP